MERKEFETKMAQFFTDELQGIGTVSYKFSKRFRLHKHLLYVKTTDYKICLFIETINSGRIINNLFCPASDFTFMNLKVANNAILSFIESNNLKEKLIESVMSCYFYLLKYRDYSKDFNQPIYTEESLETILEIFKNKVIPDILFLANKYSSLKTIDEELNAWFILGKRMPFIDYVSYPPTHIILGLLSAHFNKNPHLEELKKAYWHEAKKKKHAISDEEKELIKTVISKI